MADTYLNKTGLAYFWAKIKSALAGKQNTLISGTNIKTINGGSILGSGDLEVGAVAMTDAEIEAAVDAGWVETLPFWVVLSSGATREFLFENGMTWNQWAESDYNTDGYYISGGYIYVGMFYIENASPTSAITQSTYNVTSGGGND